MRKTITSMVLGLGLLTLSRVACAQLFANPAPPSMLAPSVTQVPPSEPPQASLWQPEVLSLSANPLDWAPGRWDRPR